MSSGTLRAPVIETSGLDHLALRVTDLARSRRFYAEVLGLPIVVESERVFIMQVGDTLVGCVGPDGDMPDRDRFSPHRVGLDHLAARCADETSLQRVAAALTAAGVEHTGIRVNPVRGNRYVAFRDPDGIAWQVAVREG